MANGSPSAATASQISINAAFGAKIETPGDRDWFKLNLEAGHRYSFSMTGGSVGGMSGLTSPHLYFYDSNSVLIGDAAPSSINAGLIASVGTTGTYYIVAGSHLGSGIGGYALAVSPSGTFTPGPPPPPPPPPPSGTAPPRLDLDAVDPDMLEDGDSIIFKVEYSGTLTGDVAIGWSVRGTGDHPTDSLDFLRTSGEVTLRQSDDDEQVYIRLSPNEDKLDEFDEDFEIEIRVISGNATISDDSGSGTIINDDAGRIHPDVDELNNSFGTAMWVPEDTWARGFVTTFGDVDYFAFTLTGGATYDLIVIGDNDTSLIDGTESGFIRLSDPQASLYNQNFQLITGQFNAPINSSRISYQFTPATTGLYYVAVREDGHNDVGQYFIQSDLRIPADDYAASTTTTGRLDEGVSVLANNERDGDSDWFKVELIAGRTYSFYAVDQSSAELDQDGVTWPGWTDELVIVVRNSAGTIIATEPPNSASTSSRPAQITFTATQTGTFFLSVEGADSSQRYLVGYDELTAPPAGSYVTVQPGPQEGIDLTFNRLRDGLDEPGSNNSLLSVGGIFLTSSGSVLRFDTSSLPGDAVYAAIEIYFTGAVNDSQKALAALAMMLGAPTGAWDEESALRALGDFTFEGFLPAPGAVGWYRIEITELYNAWQSGARANNGIILLPTDMISPRNQFHSSDAADAALRPRLIVYERVPSLIQGSEGYDILAGTDYADRIYGLASDDLIAAARGADWVDGGAGADIIDGGDGIDTVSYASSPSAVAIDLANNHHTGGFAEGDSLLNVERVEGSAFADTLVGSLFEDTLLGGGGSDILWGREGNDRLDGGPGADWSNGGSGDDTYFIDDPADFIVELAGGGNDRITSSVSYALAAGVHVETLSAGDSARTDPLTLVGNEFGNTVIGNAGANLLYGMGGTDRLEGLAGNDRYVVDVAGDVVAEALGGGYDTVFSPVSYGLAAASEVEALSTLDRLGTQAIDFTGNEFGNALYGNAGANRLSGGAGDDWLDGGDGDDRLEGGEGVDTALYWTAGAAVTVSLALLGTAQNTGGGGIDTLTDVENLFGSAFGDTLVGNGAANLLDGREGADTMRGGAGDDTYYVDNVADVVEELAGEGFDTICASLAVYSLLGTQIERLGSASDIAHDFRGNAANNVISGGAGNDFLRLQDGGTDTAIGGLGNDVFLFGSAMDGLDAVDGGGGLDQIALQGDYAGARALTFGLNVLAIENIAILPGSDTRFGDPGTNFYDYNITTGDINVAAGVQMVVDANRLRLGEDFTFSGASETDGSFFIYGGGGVDLLTGGAKNDVFLFGAQGQWGATDVIDGGPGGIDQLALRGNYTLTFGAGQLIGIENIGLLSAHDTRFGALGSSYSYDLTMVDENVAARVQMIVDGAKLRVAEFFRFDGSAELDGSFRVFGGLVDDIIIGTRNSDFIQGNGGADRLAGGAGADTFRYLSASDSTSSAMDRILDFTAGADKIDLGRIDADIAAAGDQAFSWIGSNAFSGSAGQLRAFQQGGDWILEGDINGDGVADLVIALTLQGPTPLGAGDFLL